MHDGSIKTIEEVIDHYLAGGRTIKTGPNAGVGFENPNKSEFVKRIELSEAEKADLIAFLRSLTDQTVLTDPSLSSPFAPALTRRAPAKPRYVVYGQVVHVFPEDGALTLYHDEIPGLISAMKPPYAMEFLVTNREQLKSLKPGQTITASVRRQGTDYVLDDLRPMPAANAPARKGGKR
jgi:Cu/Ag efflux protein CusF